MEDIIELFFVFIIIGVSAIAKAGKSKARSEAAKQRLDHAGRSNAEFAQQKSVASNAHPYAPSITPADVPGQAVLPLQPRPVMPTVHTHLQPDCETHDKPGSLGVVSMEGKDPCHEEQLTHDRTYDEPEPTASGLTLEWSGENMVKAFIMQEVLTRPSQRNAMRRPAAR